MPSHFLTMSPAQSLPSHHMRYFADTPNLHMSVVVSLGNGLCVGSKFCLYEITELKSCLLGPSCPPGHTIVSYIHSFIHSFTDRHILRLLVICQKYTNSGIGHKSNGMDLTQFLNPIYHILFVMQVVTWQAARRSILEEGCWVEGREVTDMRLTGAGPAVYPECRGVQGAKSKPWLSWP